MTARPTASYEPAGGHKQRIAIARVLLKKPKVLICDEATSSLGPHTVSQIARTVNRLNGHITILFISHGLPNGLKVNDEWNMTA